ncbi:MAG: aspartate carbamoyltransferase [Methylobacter sp.]
MKKIALLACLLVLFFATAQAQESDTGKHAANSADAHQTLPYAVDQALEGFAKMANGGIMQIVVKSTNDSQQIKLMQQYLRQTAEEYGKGDFSSTERFHGTDMPGLAQMKAAKAGEIKYQYKALNNGGQIVFSTEDAQLLNALHAWIDAQIKEHGSAGLSGHE